MEQMSISGVEPAPKNAQRKRRGMATRGDYYGIKANLLVRDAKIKIAKMRAKIERLQEPWNEADQMIEAAVAQVTEALDALVKQFDDSAEYMNEAMDE